VGRFVIATKPQTAFYSAREDASRVCHSAVKPGDKLYLGESMGIVFHREQYRPRLACLYHSTLHPLLAALYQSCRLGRFQVTSASRTTGFTSLDRCEEATLSIN
jgi:hypothetical protein